MIIILFNFHKIYIPNNI